MAKPQANIISSRAGRLLWQLVGGLLVLSAAVVSGLPGAGAAELAISARVDADEIGLDDTVQLTVTVTSDRLRGLDTPDLPSLSDFRLLGTSTQSSVSIVNARISNSISYIYTLKPQRTGKLTIGAFRVGSGRETRSSAPLTIQVTEGGGGGSEPGGGRGRGQQGGQPGWPAPGRPRSPFGEDMGWERDEQPHQAVVVKHQTNRKTAYVGQQITYTFGFYQAEQILGDVSYSPASTTGFVAEELPNPPHQSTTIDGRQYVGQQRLKALFATAPGQFTIGEASVDITVDPFIGPEKLVADPITVTILPLPEAGRPAGFAGAVGRFKLNVQPDRTILRVGESANLRVRLSGTGNLRSTGPPQITAPEGLRVYKAGEDRQIAAGGGGGSGTEIGGTVTFDFMVLARQAGTITLPGVNYPYFDPVQRVYRVLRSEPITFTVQPGTEPLASEGEEEADLRPLKDGPGRRPWPLLIYCPAWWVLLGLPLALLGWAGWGRWRQVRVSADPVLARAESALRLARRRFGKAEQCLRHDQLDGCYAELNAALADYVADRTDAPPAGLQAEEVERLLQQAGADSALAAQTRQLLERTAAGRFGPGAGVMEPRQLVVECRELVETLQRQVKASRG